MVLAAIAFFLWKCLRRSTFAQKKAEFERTSAREKAESTGKIAKEKEEFERKQKDGQHLEAVETSNDSLPSA